MSKYGFTGGFRRPVETGRDLDPDTQEAWELRRRQKAYEAKQNNFNPRFRPVFDDSRKLKWYNFRIRDPRWHMLVFGVGGGVLWLSIVWQTVFSAPESKTHSQDRDELIRAVHTLHKDKWFAFAIPYRWRYKELLDQDLKASILKSKTE